MPSSRHNPFLIAALAAALAGCSSSQSPSSAEVAAEPAASAGPAAPEPASAQADPAPKGDCDLITHDELSQAFGDKLTVRGSSGRGGICNYDIAQVDGSQLILQAGDAAAYVVRKDTYSHSGVPMVPLALGKEAFLVDHAQIIVLAEDDQSLSIGLMMITIGQPAPVEQNEIAVALESLARTALARM